MTNRSRKATTQTWMGRMGRRTKTKKATRVRRRPLGIQKGGAFDVQKALAKTGIEFHWPGYQYLGPGTKIEEMFSQRRPRD